MNIYFDTPSIGVGFPVAEAKPSIQPNHIDGPLLVFSDGQLHWLTWRERLLFWLGFTDAWALEEKHRPNLTRALAPYRKNVRLK